MGSEELDSSPSRGKHRRSQASGDEAAEDSSKRRKHHRHHHRHHRRHGKHVQEREEGDELPPSSAAATTAVEAAPRPPKPADDEREEGEILEEDEGEIAGVVGLDPGRGSDVESGEIEREDVPDLAPKAVNNESLIRPCDYTGGKGDYKVEGITTLNEREDSKNHGVKGEDLVGEIDIPDSLTSALNDAERRTGSNGEARQKQPKSRTRRTEKEKKHAEVESDDLKSQDKSGSPELHLMGLGRRDNGETRGLDHDYGSGRLEKRRHPESGNDNREDLDVNNRYRDIRTSPEEHHRDRSRSRDYKREREPDHEPYTEVSARSHRQDSQVSARGETEHQLGVSHDRADRYAVRSRDGDGGIHRERERSLSRSRYDRLEDRHGSRDRGSERERYSSSIRERDDIEIDKGARHERERSSSYSRRDSREDRHGSRDRGRDRERYNSYARDKDRDKPRDTSREMYKESGRLRDADNERELVKVSVDRDRSWTNDREHREWRERMDKDRINNRDRHRDSRTTKYDEREHHKDRRRSNEFAKDANSNTQNTEDGKERATREKNEEVYLERIEEQLAKDEEEDVDKIKEESRKRRQAILEKYKQQQMQQCAESQSSDHVIEKHASADKDNEQWPNAGNAVSQAIPEGPENKHDSSDMFVADPSFSVGKSPIQNGASALERTSGAGGLGEGTPKSERSADMFCDDIFGESPTGVRKSGNRDGVQIVRSGLHDNWDDAEGYYSYRLGEVLDGHFEIKSFHGKGVFSTVVRAKDLKAGKGEPEEVAIKIIRNNDTMYKAGLEELVILKKLSGADPEDKRHCVRFLSSFKYRNHLCLVFESLHMNLREVLKKFGRNIGLNLTAVRAYANQLFIALKHLKNCGVLHCDIKPDNMLVNEAKNVLKLCDFGNAMFAGKNEITPYLVSRFYRAPEIILGLPYDHPMDMWSVGCCLYEIYTGKVLFPGPSNNDMLRLHMELKGPVPKKMLRKGGFTNHHFDQDSNFHATEEDPVTKKSVKRMLPNIKPKEIGALISSSLGEDPKMLASFKDLLDKIFYLEPEKRLTVAQALSHSFITGK